MRAGRGRQLRARRRESIEKVRAYREWLHAGSDFKTMPAVPTDADFRVERRYRSEGTEG
jgi:hypothetical protein